MNEEDYIPLSSLSHFWFCPRRAGLLLINRAWSDNEFTVLGHQAHQRVHEEGMERRGDHVRLNRFYVESARLGLRGYCDLVEASADGSGVELPDLHGHWRLYPVEYKHGAFRDEIEYEVQLCAQAMCLEEMLDTSIPCGALFYTNVHRRKEVILDEQLRNRVVEGAAQIREMLMSQHVPSALESHKCKKCSMFDSCMPYVCNKTEAYIRELYQLASRNLEQNT